VLDLRELMQLAPSAYRPHHRPATAPATHAHPTPLQARCSSR
jgi:hypothetical protein